MAAISRTASPAAARAGGSPQTRRETEPEKQSSFVMNYSFFFNDVITEYVRSIKVFVVNNDSLG